ncbi:MAG TPA: CvpA family protein [Gemmataceae bacterium]|nr:CvpA family protein [Gemmataceae bacterium]
MYWLDTTILVLLAAGAGLGAWTGLLKQIVRVVGLVAALAAAVFFHGTAADALRKSVLQGSDPMLADGVAYVAVFLGVLLAFQVTAMLIDRLLKAVKLKWADRVLGCIVGGFKTALILGALALAAMAFPPNDATIDALKHSQIAPVLARGAYLAWQAVPPSYTERLRKNVDPLFQDMALPSPASKPLTPPAPEHKS